MLSIVTKCQLIFVSVLLSVSTVTVEDKDALQDLRAISTPSAIKTVSLVTIPTPESPAETAVLLSEISTPQTEPLVPDSALTAQASFTTTLVITPTAISHALYGVGVHMFDNDHNPPTAFEEVLDTLGLKYLRVPFGPNWDAENIPDPPACNDEEDPRPMYEFIKQNFNGDFDTRLENAKAISDIAEARNLEIIFLNWRAHKNWLIDLDYKELREESVDDYACFVTEVVKFLADEGVKISYLEPTNEPSNTQDTKVPPALYNTFVKNLRARLDEEGLFEVKILGPGLAYLSHDDTCRIYIEALDDDGVDALSAWTFHAWDPEFFSTEPEEDILRMKWEECQEAIKAREGTAPPKPFFITEYACVNVNEEDPSNTICAVQNTLTLFDLGANVVVYWYLKEQGWDGNWKNAERALLEEDSTAKPTFTALASVLPVISGDGVEILKTQIDGGLTAASFYKVDHALGEKQLIVVLANSYPESKDILIYINESSPTDHIADRILYDSEMNTIQDPEPVPCPDGLCQLSLRPNTITTLILDYGTLYLPIIKRGEG